uniref:PIR2-like helical domain-containing protein n=1 Tax=Arundo donax TaxID=35708 RepID=A0A0A9CWA9_ARUDO
MSNSGSGSSPGSSGSTRSSTASDRRVLLSDLLGHIHVYYKAAIDRLPVEELPVLIPRLLEAGVCFGLLDPVSNIIVNTICSCEPNAAAQGEAGDKRSKRGRNRNRNAENEEALRRRDEAMSEITTDASSISRLPPILGGAKIWKRRTVAQRSLEGLVTFLICYFRHLPVSEALHYLLLAKADLLAAVHLIECSRGMGDRLCPVSFPTTPIALRCAAMSASHPEPAILAARLLSLASHPEQLSHLPSIGHCLSPDGLNRLHKLLEEALKQTAESRDIKGTNSLIEFPLEFTETLRSLLLEKIHVLYLKAIAQLPTDGLRRRHHRGLLKGGLCFGPADDPVSNIILNAIWYDTTFPAPVEFKVDMIGTKSLVRVECQSLIGLLAFLRNLFPALSEHEAMLYLFRSNASLQKVISRALQDHDMSSSYEDAYKAAAEAAEHPHPDAQAEFATSTCSKLLPILQSWRGVSRALTSSEVELISSYFSQKPCPGKSVQSVPKLLPRAAEIVSHHQQNFMANQDFISRKVNAALQRYTKEKFL